MTIDSDARSAPGTPPPQPPFAAGAGASYKDRRTGLVLFGVLLIAAGALFLLLAAAMAAGTLALSRVGGESANAHAVLVAVPMYVALAAGLVWLGVGSILCRRWAPPVVLTVSWVALLTMVLAMAFTPFVSGAMAAAAASTAGEPMPEDFQVFMAGCLVALGLLGVLPPIGAILFYRSPHVKATCAARDPVPRWTDRCPTAVVGLVMTTGLTVVSLLPALLGPRAVVSGLGSLVTGAPARLALAAIIVVLAFSTWSLTRMERRGWWTLFAASVVTAMSSMVTFWYVSWADLMAVAAFGMDGAAAPGGPIPPDAFDAVFGPRTFFWLVVASWSTWLGYIWYTKRHFARDPRAPQADTSADPSEGPRS